MGVASCLALLKPVASRPVDLNDGRGFILYDGHACMHRAASKGEVAVRLALDNDVKALASDMLFELRTMEEKGWVVVVVFDGATPPSKVDTSNSRSSARLQALQQCRRLRAQQPINHKELEKQARKAAAFTPTVVARVSRILRHSLRADCITAPFEADAQLKVMEDNYSREGQRCFVRANDSDLIVLGVRSLLWDVTIDHDGRVFGECITRANVVRPQLQILHNSDASSAFLRRLHGMVANTPRSDRVWLSGSGEGVVMTNLRNWACVAGNDYSKFTGIGPVRALEFAMPFGATQTIDEIAASIAIDIQAPEEGVLTSLRTSIDMFLHPVVWDPTTGAHRHLSRATSSVDITSNTGTLASPQEAQQIAAQKICPKTRQPWSEDILESLEGFQPAPPLPHRGEPTRKRKGRPLPLRHDYTNNYQRSGFSTIPDLQTPFETWSVDALREFLSPLRCLERSGVSKLNKDELVVLIRRTIKVLHQCGLVGSPIAFRAPVLSHPPAPLPGTSPPPETAWLGWKTLREYLPEISDNIIVAWLSNAGSLKGTTGRVLYRGLQRVLDLGALGGLTGSPCGDNGGLMWLKFRATGSMRTKDYEATAAIEVERVDEIGDEARPEGGDEVCCTRIVATRVAAASCSCQGGSGGGCIHVCEMLQLTRLLQLTEVELSTWNPKSPTSVACRWILKNCGAGRDKDHNIMLGVPVTGVAKHLRQLRDPKKHALLGGVDEAVHTRGVVAMDRANDYTSHPQKGVWSDTLSHVRKGKSLSYEKWGLLEDFIDVQREEYPRDGGPSDFSPVGLDVNPLELRPDP